MHKCTKSKINTPYQDKYKFTAEKVLAICAKRCYNCIKVNNERSMAMPFTYAATVVPATGNVSANVYLIAVIVAAVLIVGAVVAGIISKKKKK